MTVVTSSAVGVLELFVGCDLFPSTVDSDSPLRSLGSDPPMRSLLKGILHVLQYCHCMIPNVQVPVLYGRSRNLCAQYSSITKGCLIRCHHNSHRVAFWLVPFLTARFC